MSIFIPVVMNTITEMDLSTIFWNGNLGKVKRVDFFINTLVNADKRSAFVHFEYWFATMETLHVQNEVLNNGSIKYWLNNNEYLIFKKMTCDPIPETVLNIHQIASKLMEMESIILEHENKIIELEKKVSEKFTENCDTIQNSIWNYCPEESGPMTVDELRSDDDIQYEQMVECLIDDSSSEKSEKSQKSFISIDSNNSIRMKMTDELCGNN